MENLLCSLFYFNSHLPHNRVHNFITPQGKKGISIGLKGIGIGLTGISIGKKGIGTFKRA